MPTYRVTDPATGKTLKLTGDSPPTEAELEQIFSSQPKTPARQGSTLSIPAQVGEGIVSIGRKAIAEPFAGLAGIAGAVGGMMPGGESPSEKGARFVEGSVRGWIVRSRSSTWRWRCLILRSMCGGRSCITATSWGIFGRRASFSSTSWRRYRTGACRS